MTSIVAADQIIADAAATVQPSSTVQDDSVISAVQAKLRALGYVEGGPPDGEVGKKTEASILDFRNRNGLPLTPTVDAELLAALGMATPKPVPIAQATANGADIAPKVQAVKETRLTKFWAKVTAYPSIISAIVIAIVDRFDEAVAYIEPIKVFASSVPGWAWLGLAGIVAAMIAYNAWRAEVALVEGYREGTVKNDNLEARAVNK